MSNTNLEAYTLIENIDHIKEFCEENKNIKWLGFDTEFVGEKRYYTLLCLLQVATENGLYLFDTLKIKDLSLLLEMIENPDILKITHAGENDYRILNMHFGTIPQNVFDIQIAAGFVGYKYPTSFRKVMERELNILLSKGYTVSDWESRPMNKKQLKYALDDVIYLHELWSCLTEKLEKFNRTTWAAYEFAKWEKADFYAIDPYKEALANSLIHSQNIQGQAFMLRLYRWRRAEAMRKDYSKEMILSSKLIGPIVRNITSGKSALKNHRRLPNKIIDQHWSVLNEMYQGKVSKEERTILNNIYFATDENPEVETIMQLIHLLIKYHCEQNKVAANLVTNGCNIKRMKSDPDFFDTKLADGWRTELLGEEMIEWMKNRTQLEIMFEDGKCMIQYKK